MFRIRFEGAGAQKWIGRLGIVAKCLPELTEWFAKAANGEIVFTTRIFQSGHEYVVAKISIIAVIVELREADLLVVHDIIDVAEFNG